MMESQGPHGADMGRAKYRLRYNSQYSSCSLVLELRQYLYAMLRIQVARNRLLTVIPRSVMTTRLTSGPALASLCYLPCGLYAHLEHPHSPDAPHTCHSKPSYSKHKTNWNASWGRQEPNLLGVNEEINLRRAGPMSTLFTSICLVSTMRLWLLKYILNKSSTCKQGLTSQMGTLLSLGLTAELSLSSPSEIGWMDIRWTCLQG